MVARRLAGRGGWSGRWGQVRAYAGSVKRELLFIRAGFGPDAMDYERAWELQRDLHARRVSGELPDLCLLLEHQPVYTAGKRTSPLDRPVGDPGAPVIEVDRGGKITWHGPYRKKSWAARKTAQRCPEAAPA